MSGLVEGKTAVVTGSSSGIGAGIAKVLAREGADVVVHYRTNLAGARKTAREVRGYGRRALVVQADVRLAEEVNRLFNSVLGRFDRIDLLVNNAGMTTRRPFLESDEALFDAVMDTDVRGLFLCSHRAASIMKEQGGGRIINISSIHDKLTSHHFSLYAAAKGAVSRMTAAMAVDLADFGITVNAIAPGWVPVESDGEYPKALLDAFSRCVPAGRPGTPEDVGELAAFLASDRAAWLTGQVIHLDGGASCMIHMPSRRLDRHLYEPGT
ncbi:MAG: 3-oxoacyl-ACP reductase family protein [Planctomycetota bacterium]